ncbi:Phosphate-binding protein PstS 1 precursor [Stieleria neptunia]|uniref:Phosphate-binding protein PstS 1 n=1 Tax=Stieleria neptunia TaxID=2527979 RepID=A0A518HW58_9BACT|nr:phosphate ABC transporter substrate-binding protein [Stieleria neptunia]QDV45089.1 Phosphate-binding protein PstS 1 precursor [Stieleria neptunia]
MTEALAITGFLLAAYSIVANDAIQTLGTFLSSNAKRPWWVLWAFACTVLMIVFVYGWLSNDGDVAFGRLSKFPEPAGGLTWLHIIPPLVILGLTRFGIPVSTTFLVLSVFAPGNMTSMLTKSMLGYLVSFFVAIGVYVLITKSFERKVRDSADAPPAKYWIGLQWISTAFLWSQWLMHDLANIFVYLPRKLDSSYFFFAAIVMLVLHAYIFSRRGGEIQKIVNSKTNTSDIRSATIVDLIYGMILVIFKEYSNMPMSTTWVFLGLLAGRETAISLLLKAPPLKQTTGIIFKDASKAAIGLAISALLAFVLPMFFSSAVGTADASSDVESVTAPDGESLAQLAPFQGTDAADFPQANLHLAGSDTMRPLAKAWIEQFNTLYPQVAIDLRSEGSASAIKAMASGQAEIGLMSRPMNREELNQFRGKFDTHPLVIRVGLDALAVYVHRDNPLRGLTLPQLREIFAKKQSIEWKKFVLPPFPSTPIETHGRNELSGTRQYFMDTIGTDGLRSDIQTYDHSEGVVQAVGESISAIGYAGLNFTNDSVRPIAIAQKEHDPYSHYYNEKHPNATSLQRRFAPVYSGQYPLARYLYLIVHKPNGETLSPQIAAFLNYAISREGQAVVMQSGLIPLDTELQSIQAIRLQSNYVPRLQD